MPGLRTCKVVLKSGHGLCIRASVCVARGSDKLSKAGGCSRHANQDMHTTCTRTHTAAARGKRVAFESHAPSAGLHHDCRALAKQLWFACRLATSTDGGATRKASTGGGDGGGGRASAASDVLQYGLAVCHRQTAQVLSTHMQATQTTGTCRYARNQRCWQSTPRHDAKVVSKTDVFECQTGCSVRTCTPVSKHLQRSHEPLLLLLLLLLPPLLQKKTSLRSAGDGRSTSSAPIHSGGRFRSVSSSHSTWMNCPPFSLKQTTKESCTVCKAQSSKQLVHQ